MDAKPTHMTALPAVLVNRFAIYADTQMARIVFVDGNETGHETPRVAVAMSAADFRALRDAIDETLKKLVPN